MQRKYQRFSEEKTLSFEDTVIEPLHTVVEVITTAELQWGAKCNDNGENLEFKTKVFGNIDVTYISGTANEMRVMRNVVNSYNNGGTPGVTRYLLIEMGLLFNHNEPYSFSDVIVLFELYLNNEEVESLFETLKPKPVVVTAIPTLKDLDQIYDAKKNFELENDDGAMLQLMGFYSNQRREEGARTDYSLESELANLK